MKKLILIVLLSGIVKLTNAQVTPDSSNKSVVYTAIESPPSFAGPGTYVDFLRKNLIYPQKAVKDNVQGKVVVQFIINVHGGVENARILRSVSAELDTEALRVVRLMTWHPGIQNGRPVRSYFTMPLNFSLNNGAR